MPKQRWWQTGVVYQITPAHFRTAMAMASAI